MTLLINFALQSTFSMENKQHLDNLSQIRQIMERSTTFLSLSGLSGVFAGVFAILGAALAYWYAGNDVFAGSFLNKKLSNDDYKYFSEHWFFAIDAAIIFICAISSAYYFSLRKSRRLNQKMWSPVSRKLLEALFVPLVTGALFCLILMGAGSYKYVPGITLIFYGLGLVAASSFTLPDVKYLGYSEILIGLITILAPEFGFTTWIIGFGVFHISYGARMFLKYDRTLY